MKLVEIIDVRPGQIRIKKVTLQRGRETDLKYDGGVFDIELGERIA